MPSASHAPSISISEALSGFGKSLGKAFGVAASEEAPQDKEFVAMQNELKYMAAVMEEKDIEIAKLKEQVKRFDFLETLAIELMRNTIALVDQAEEKRLEGNQ